MTFKETAAAARDWALSKVGCRYSQAKRTQANIFDCSSLIARAFSAQGKGWLYGGKVPLSCNEVYDDDFELIWPASYGVIGDKLGGAGVIAKAKQPGDLQFLHTMATGRANRITHVTMVASDGKIVHARGTAYGVRTDSLTHYAGKVCALVRYNPDCDLVYGHKGYRTKALQLALIEEINTKLSGDGEFGPKTLEAVKAFQTAKGLPVTGKGDQATRAALGLIKTVDGETPTDGMDADATVENTKLGARVLKQGDEGPDVAELQEGFVTLGGAGGWLWPWCQRRRWERRGRRVRPADRCLRAAVPDGRNKLPGTGIFNAATFVAFTCALAAALLASEVEDDNTTEAHEPSDDEAAQSEVVVYPSTGYLPDVSANQRTFRPEVVARKCPFVIMRARVAGKTDSTYKARAAAILGIVPHWAYDYIKTTSIGNAHDQADAMYDLCQAVQADRLLPGHRDAGRRRQLGREPGAHPRLCGPPARARGGGWRRDQGGPLHGHVPARQPLQTAGRDLRHGMARDLGRQRRVPGPHPVLRRLAPVHQQVRRRRAPIWASRAGAI